MGNPEAAAQEETGHDRFCMIPKINPSRPVFVNLAGALMSLFSRKAVEKHFCIVRSVPQPAKSIWSTLLHVKARLELPHCSDGECTLNGYTETMCAVLDLVGMAPLCGFDFKTEFGDLCETRTEVDQASPGVRSWVCFGFSPSIKGAILKAAQYTVAPSAVFIGVGGVLNTPFCPELHTLLPGEPTTSHPCMCRTRRISEVFCCKIQEAFSTTSMTASK